MKFTDHSAARREHTAVPKLNSNSKAESFRMPPNQLMFDQARYSTNFVERQQKVNPNKLNLGNINRRNLNQSVDLHPKKAFDTPQTPFSNHSIHKVLTGTDKSEEGDFSESESPRVDRVKIKNKG